VTADDVTSASGIARQSAPWIGEAAASLYGEVDATVLLLQSVVTAIFDRHAATSNACTSRA